MDKGEFSSVLSHAYLKKFSSKINVPNSFKSLLTDSNVFFLWFDKSNSQLFYKGYCIDLPLFYSQELRKKSHLPICSSAPSTMRDKRVYETSAQFLSLYPVLTF